MMARARMLGSPAARPLDGVWEIAALAPGQALEPAHLGAAQARWMACDGPMPVAAALQAAGRWDIDEARDLDSEDWWYRCRFVWPDAFRPYTLRFGGLATVADVWLNGHHVLHSESMFVAHAVHVERGLPGSNDLVLRFHALSPLLAVKRPRPRWRTHLVSHQALRWYRTSLLGRIPAWCPPVAPVGPWRPITIENGSLIVDRADINAGGKDGFVRFSLRVTHPYGDTIEGTFTVGSHDVPLTCEPLSAMSGGSSLLTGVVRVPRPNLWWPHTHGAPSLYRASASIKAGGVVETIDFGRIGFRRIEVDRDADGHGFGLVVNGTPVFCRGVCWTPLDLARLSAEPAEYRSALEQLRSAGMNMVRVGGTMTYETDLFHDLCDELGILVWQDFMFANMDYPWEDEAFARSVALEVAQTLARLQSRPSLAVVCGASEVEQQAAMIGLPESRRPHLSEGLLSDLVQKVAPEAVWLASTPSGGTFPFQVDSGVSHYYGVGAYQRPFEDARRAGVRFAAECLAFSNVPDAATIGLTLRDGDAPGSHPRWKARVPRDAGVGWDFEDVRDHYVARLFAIAPAELRARDPERYLALGRVASGEAMLRTFSEWRRPGSSCRGGLVWFARDLWPGAGWGVIDATGQPKAAYWYLKRALAPVALLSADEGLNGLWFHAVNDTAAPIDADLRITLYRDGLIRRAPVSTTLTIPGRGHQSIHADELFDGFLDLTYAYRFGPPGHDVVAATLRDHASGALHAAACYFPGALPADRVADLGLAACVEPAGEGYELILETERFAHAVTIDVDGWSPDDNYLHLEPGEKRRIALRPTAGGVAPRGYVSALNGGGEVPLVVVEAAHARR